jgi:predicted GTPase
MAYGAGLLAAQKYGASKIIDPRPFAVGSIKAAYQKYTHLDRILPALGYGKKQMAELAQTIDKAKCDLVVSGTPIDLGRLIKTNKRILRVKYDLEEIGSPNLKEVLQEF